MSSRHETKHAVLDLVGATCASCALGIEHMGRRIAGVTDIYVERGRGEIHLDYDGNTETIERIETFVRTIGYDAVLRESIPKDAQSARND